MTEMTTLMRLDGVKAATGLSRASLYRRIAEKTFPSPKRYPGSNLSFWPSDEVRAWIGATISNAETVEVRHG